MSDAEPPGEGPAAPPGKRRSEAPGKRGGVYAPGTLYRALFALVLGRLPAEAAHRLAGLALRAAARTPGLAGLMRRRLQARDPALRVRALGLTFPSPLGAAAGVDKDGRSFEALGLLGFGFVEVGTVTARAQAGNPKPRVFRIARERALLNRMGFPNPGARALAARLERRRKGEGAPPIVGVNVGKGMATPLAGAAGDYAAAVRELAPVCDYLVLNVSSPNTPGLRELETVARLRELLAAVERELAALGGRTPLLVKMSPDLGDEQVDAVADLALERGLAGIVAVNTTADRGVLADPAALARIEGGGVSGRPLRARALAVLERLRARGGGRLALISVGGVEDADDVWERLQAGATLVQAYTGFVYGGPLWPARVSRELARRVRAAGASSLQELLDARDTPSADPAFGRAAKLA